MKNSFVVAKKDLVSYFQSWTGVLLCFFFFLIAGLFFSLLVLSYAKFSLNAARQAFEGVEGMGVTRFVFGSFFINMAIVMIFLIPLLSMRAFAEERRYQTLELLYTYPLSDFEIVWGKFLGMVWFFELLLVPTLIYVAVVAKLGGAPDLGPVLIGYLGFWLLGTAYLSLGLFISSISESPIVSAVLTFSFLIVFWLLDWAVSVSDGPVSHFLSAVSPLTHYRDFTVGVLDLSHVVYFMFFHFFFLFLTMRSIETRNWKG